MDLLQLYIYFSRFVPVEVLKRNHVAGQTPDTGAEQLQQEVLDTESDERIETIGDYLFLGDQDFVLERLRNSRGQLLFVDSDRLDYAAHVDDGVRLSIGVTVAEHYNRSNASVVSELVVQNRCLETLKRIVSRLTNEPDDTGCPICLNVEQSAEIRFFDAYQLNGLIGYTAFFTLTSSDYDMA